MTPTSSLVHEAKSNVLGREDWIQAAITVFASQGIESVRVERLAARLAVTKGSFYWHFKNREDLHQAVMSYWSNDCTQAMIQRIEAAADIIGVVLNLFEIWIKEKPFSPRLDAAMRDWARRSELVKKHVEQTDRIRTQAIAQAFQRYGYTDHEAHVRARVLYFMQIGYYEANLRDSLEGCLNALPTYMLSFTGRVLAVERLTEYRQRFVDREE